MATYSWNGGSGVWTLASNWTVGGIPATVSPGASDDVVIAAAGVYTISLGTASAASLTLTDPNASVVIGGGLTVQGSLTNAGTIKLATGASLTDLGQSGAFFTNSGSIVVGNGGSLTIFAAATTAGLGTLVNNGGNMALTLVLDNTGAVFVPPSVGSNGWIAGTVFHGVISTGAGAKFGNILNSGVQLVGVTVDGGLYLEGANGSITGGITLHQADGTGAGTLTVDGNLNILDTESLDNGTLTLSPAIFGGFGNSLNVWNGVTFGPGFTLKSPEGGYGTAMTGAGGVVNQGTISAQQPLYVTTASLTNSGLIATGTNFINFGMLSRPGPSLTTFNTTDGIVTNDGIVLSGGGDVVFRGSVLGSGTIAVSANGTINGAIEMTGFYDRQVFAFLDSSASLLKFDAPSGINAVLGFRPGNTIELVGTPASVVFNNTTLSVQSGGTTIAGFVLPDVAPGWSFQATTDAFANTFITEIPCFAAGTRLATAEGEVPVEQLREGDLLRTAGGALAPVRWIGRRTVNCARHPRPWDVLPIRVAAGAFAPGQPLRDLWLSPDHAVFHAGHLIPVRYLLNGRTIRQVEVESVTYLHVELPAHDIVLAEGLACESYLDTGNRAAFAGAITDLHPDFARAAWSRAAWTRAACAKLVIDGPIRTAARRHLLARAEAGGHRLTNDPGLVIASGPRILSPFVAGPNWRLTVPDGGAVDLRSRAFIPAHTRADADDTRRLGVAIANPRIDGRAIPLDHPCFGAGWHAPEPDWRWSDGMARLLLHGGAEFAFDLVMAGRYWADCAPAVLPTRALVA
ncbi:MAG: Hint domain-containing protein [Alphaproteobacteria bacterium]|nr:Hint domain-containing protein [Alphaproteobacteria bacterium]